MQLTRVAGENFRLFERLAFSPQPGLNLLLGDNAAGKTTVLEALYALGRGRSFRAAPEEIAGRAGAFWQVAGQARHTGLPQGLVSLGLAWSPEGLRPRLEGADSSVQQLVRRLPMEVLEPDSHRLLEDGPAYRRRYLDWGVFHVEHRFFPAWRRYRTAQRQRNAALKAGAPGAEIETWNPALAAAGEEIQGFRQAHLVALSTRLSGQTEKLLGPGQEVSVELARGWSPDRTLAEALAGNLVRDRRLGTTRLGPHRAELKLKFHGRMARHHVSRGQQKMLVGALLLAQAELVAAATGRRPILLIDDFPAELGAEFQGAFLRAAAAYGGQVFLTAIEPTETLKKCAGATLFHVEHGSIRAV